MDLPSPKLTKLSPTGLALLVLSLHTGLFVVPAFFELFEEALIGELPLRNLERLLDIIVVNSDFQRFPFTK